MATENMGTCRCPDCGKVYTGNPETDQVCMACWTARVSKDEVDQVLAELEKEEPRGAGGYNFYAEPNNIQAMSRDDVLDYLRECPKGRPTWRAVGHNSATPNGCGIEIPRGFQAYHIYHNGWADIGYHWVIDTCGTIYLGRNLIYAGAHAYAEGNVGSMGWCWVGDFSGGGGLPSREQIDSAAFLCGAHRATFGYGRDGEWGHRWVVKPEHATSCPGMNITLEMMRQWVCQEPAPPKPEEDDMDINDYGPGTEVDCGVRNPVDGDIWVKVHQHKGLPTKGKVSFSTIADAVPFELKPEKPPAVIGTKGRGVQGETVIVVTANNPVIVTIKQ